MSKKTDKDNQPDKDDCVEVERVGGLAGFGGPRLKSAGEVAMSALSAEDRKAIEAMFRGAARAGAGKPDGFVYRITSVQVVQNTHWRPLCSKIAKC